MSLFISVILSRQLFALTGVVRAHCKFVILEKMLVILGEVLVMLGPTHLI